MRPGVSANRYIVRENDKNGKIIGAYPTKALLMKDLGTKNRDPFTKENIRKLEETEEGGYLHRGVLLVRMYNAETHGPFQNISTNEERVIELSSQAVPKYIVRESNKYGKIIGAYPTLALLMKDLGTTNPIALIKKNIRELEETEEGGYLHRGVLLVQTYNAEKHGPFQNISKNKKRVLYTKQSKCVSKTIEADGMDAQPKNTAMAIVLDDKTNEGEDGNDTVGSVTDSASSISSIVGLFDPKKFETGEQHEIHITSTENDNHLGMDMWDFDLLGMDMGDFDLNNSLMFGDMPWELVEG